MTEEKEFVRWLLLVAFLIFGIGKGIPAALILAIPEPNPPLASATADAIWLSWDLHRATGQAGLLRQLDDKAHFIQIDAELAAFGVAFVPKLQSYNEWTY